MTWQQNKYETSLQMSALIQFHSEQLRLIITLIPCEQRTIDLNSQLPVKRCISSLSPAAWSPPNWKVQQFSDREYARRWVQFGNSGISWDEMTKALIPRNKEHYQIILSTPELPGWKDVSKTKNGSQQLCISRVFCSASPKIGLISLCNAQTPLRYWFIYEIEWLLFHIPQIGTHATLQFFVVL